MTRFKTVDDLDEDSMGSIGGAAGAWPYRTLWYLCRWERTGQTDPGVIDALQEQNLTAIRDLIDTMSDHGMSPHTLRERSHALAAADVDELRGALSQAYREEFGAADSAIQEGGQCPYEREGSDMACHRCPVAPDALARLADERTESNGPRVPNPEEEP